MADLHITGELAERIRKAAADANMDIEEILDSRFPSDSKEQASEPRPGTAGALLAAMQKAKFRSGYTDTSERFDEILNSEVADDLLRRHSGEDKDA